MIQEISGQISFGVGLAINAGLGIASVTGGGNLEFTMNLQAQQPYIYSGTVTGIVYLTYQALIWSGTIWSRSGTLYQWPSDPSGAVDPSNFTVTTRYYDTPNYESLVWVNGSSTGTAIQDIYPYTRISA